MKKYYIIPTELAAMLQRTQKGENILYFTQIKTGEFVINVDCGEELFPEIDWASFTQRSLKISDFPEQPPLN